MNFDLLTDDDISTLIALPKQVSNPTVRWQEKPGHQQRNYKLVGGNYIFELYQRQNLFDKNDFSCGLKVIKPNGQPLTLLRHNGSSHIHRDIVFLCHIHKATHKNIAAGKKPDSYAEPTNRYRSLDGALACLVDDANISGLETTQHDMPSLFQGSWS